MAQKMRQHFKDQSEEAESKFKKVEESLATVKTKILKAKQTMVSGLEKRTANEKVSTEMLNLFVRLEVARRYFS